MVERAVPAPCRDSRCAVPLTAGLSLRAAGRVRAIRGERGGCRGVELGGGAAVRGGRRRPATGGGPAGGIVRAAGGVRRIARGGPTVDRASVVSAGRAGEIAAVGEGGAIVRGRAVVFGMGSAGDGGGGARGEVRDRGATPHAAGVGG